MIAGNSLRALALLVFSLLVLLASSLFQTKKAPVDNKSLEPILLAISTPSQSNLQLAEESWKKTSGPSVDALTKYAMSLAYARNDQTQQALNVLECLPSQARRAGPWRRLQLWLLIRLKKDDEAQAQFETFLAELQSKGRASPTPGERADLIFLARLIADQENYAAHGLVQIPQSAGSWRKSLQASVPNSWTVILTDIDETIEQERKITLQSEYAAWRLQIDQDLLARQQNEVELIEKEAEISAQLAVCTADHRAFVQQSQVQRSLWQAQYSALVRQRSALRPPRPPRKANMQNINNVDQLFLAKEKERKDEEVYQRELVVFQQLQVAIQAQLAPIMREAKEIQRQESVLQQQRAFQESALRKNLEHLVDQIKIEQRLTSQIAASPTWESPPEAVVERARKAFAVISYSDEVDRIRGTQNQ